MGASSLRRIKTSASRCSAFKHPNWSLTSTMALFGLDHVGFLDRSGMPAMSLVTAAASVRQAQRIVADEPAALVEAEGHQAVAGESQSGVGSSLVGVQLYDAAQQNGNGDVRNTVAPAPCQGRRGDSARPAVAASDDAGRSRRCAKRATENEDLNRCWRSINFGVEFTFNKAKHAPLVCILLVQDQGWRYPLTPSVGFRSFTGRELRPSPRQRVVGEF